MAHHDDNSGVDRRQFLRAGFAGMSLFLSGGALGCRPGSGAGTGPDGGLDAGLDAGALADATPDAGAMVTVSNIPNLGPLQPPDANGLRLPPGFTSRVVARSGQAPVAGGNYLWHGAPDGGAVYPRAGGGWIYVSNSELSGGSGGVGALAFDDAGNVVDAYSICSNTSRNCAGGRTPWGTWLTCEENGEGGRVLECDPAGVQAPIERLALGLFNHEAVAVDPVSGALYLTEDRPAGGFYRFRPTTPGDLSAGVLEVAALPAAQQEGTITWHPIPDPSGGAGPLRGQVAETTPFDGGEGIAHFEGLIYFVTKGDSRVWRYEISSGSLAIAYSPLTHPNPILSGVDNVEISVDGDVLVAEDGGDLQIVALTPAGDLLPICQIPSHTSSEITGPAFSPDWSRLYFSSQRGATGLSSDGVTYEIRGPFTIETPA